MKMCFLPSGWLQIKGIVFEIQLSYGPIQAPPVPGWVASDLSLSSNIFISKIKKNNNTPQGFVKIKPNTIKISWHIVSTQKKVTIFMKEKQYIKKYDKTTR